MSVFVEASHPSIPGANVREGLLLRGALIERGRIVALLERACTCKFENNCNYCDAIAIVQYGL